MKLRSSDRRDALSIWRVAAALFVITIIPLVIRAAPPAWWTSRSVLVENASPDDYAPVNQGQLKNIAKAATAEMDARLIGGAGDELHQLIDAWSVSAADRNDYAPVTVGQLKKVAKSFYDRLISVGLIDTYPWLKSLDPPDDFAVVNVGQVKNLFSFELPTGNILGDPIQDRLAVGQRAGSLALEAQAVWFWGSRFVADNSFQNSYPRRVAGLSNIRSVSAGDDHLVVLTGDGQVMTWGKNIYGQLGDGTTSDHDVPVAIPNLLNIRAVKAGSTHTLALQADGTILAWGDNYYGELTGDSPSSSNPVRVAGLTNVRKIAAGASRSVALKDDGTVWTWGYDHYAWQTGQDIFSAAPTQVPGLLNVIDIAVGYEHVVALKADGTVWAWGSRYANQVGNGTSLYDFQETPIQVPGLSNITKIGSGFDHTLAVASDGTVWAWGTNRFGTLGDGTTQPRETPVKVNGLTDVVAIAASSNCSMAMKSDGTVWAWGEGASGTLPDVDLHLPQQVGLGLFDPNHNGMDDRWEMEYFGNVDQAGDADFDGDGVSNLKEYLRGTDPRDYFSGITPVIEMVSGNNQIGDPGTVLSKPLTVRVRSASGAVLANAPVEFKVATGAATFAVAPVGTFQESLITRTDSNGQCSAYVMLAQIPGITSRVTVSPAMPSSFEAPSVSYRVVNRFVLPPPPTPTPDPNNTPSPSATPSPTATPTPSLPYRYAIVDLGKDLYPIRVSNNGWILLYGTVGGKAGYYRWKGGVLEPLNYAGPAPTFSATDINDEGTVVGTDEAFYNRTTGWVNNSLNDLGTGLTWAADSNNAVRFSAPAGLSWNPLRPGSIREAYFSAITNRNATTNQVNIYGGSYEGEGGCSLFDIHQPLEILNARRWTSDLAASVTLSSSHSTILAVAETFAAFIWSGPMDRVSRANSSGHYIGSRITPFGDARQGGISSSMMDGQDVSFDPADINEKTIVVGSNGAGMIVRVPGQTDLVFAGSYPIAINDHTRPPAPSAAQPSSTATPQPTPIPAPQILSWVGNALVLWELQPDGNTWHPFGLEEMIPSMEGWNYLAPSDANDTGLIVGTAWYTDPSNPSTGGEQHGFMLVPAEIVPDYNRDGKIDDNDRGRVTESEPLRWWINDDDDIGDTGGNDIPQKKEHPNFSTVPSPDGSDTGTIDGTRDLVDFFPVYLNIDELLRLFPTSGPTSYTYNLKQEGGSANFVYTDLTATGALDYVRKLTGTGANNALALGGTPDSNGALTHHITSEGVALDPAWLGKISSSAGGILLIEGRRQDTHPLVLEVYNSSGNRFTQVRLPLSLSPVEQMYRHKDLMGADNASGGPADYATGNDTVHSEPENYPDNLSNSKYFVFVHGYNVNPQASRGWNAEMFKRLHQSGSKAKFVGVTWNGAETQIPGMDVTVNYHKNVDHAFQTAKGTDNTIGFATYVENLGTNVVIAAHSLGNVVVASAICDWQTKVGRFFMIDAAVSSEVLDSLSGPVVRTENMIHPEWLDYPHQVYATDWYKLFLQEDGRRRLTWRGRFGTLGPNVFNFYSSGEEVLAEHANTLGDPSVFDIAYTRDGFYLGKYAWALQEKLKGRIRELQSFPILGSVYGGWGFTHNIGHPPHTPTAAEVATMEDSSFQTQPIFDPGFDLIEHSPSPGEPSGYVSVEPHGPEWIVDLVDPTKGSNVAASHRNTLLAEMFPATTLPIGSTFQPSFGQENNFDMQTEFKEGWPAERQNEDWRHSDLKQVAYPFIFHLFDSFVQLGKLDL